MKGPWHSLWYFLLVVFLSLWAASLWPIPVYLGVVWILLLFVLLLLQLIIALASPDAYKRKKLRDKLANPHFVKERIGLRISTVLWLVVLFLTAAIITGYVI